MPRTYESDFRAWAAARRGRLRQTAFLLSGDWFLADDLAQEALARMYAAWERVVAGGDPDAYARRVLTNLYLDHRRRPSRREEPRPEVPDGTAPTPPPAAEGDRGRLVAALRAVPPGQRAILVLRYWEDLSIEQTASALNTSPGNVKSQSSRGLDALRAAFEAQGITDLNTAEDQS